MKKVEITINGRHEEKVARQIMQAIYGAMQEAPNYTDVSVHTETIPATRRNRTYCFGKAVEYGSEKRDKTDHQKTLGDCKIPGVEAVR